MFLVRWSIEIPHVGRDGSERRTPSRGSLHPSKWNIAVRHSGSSTDKALPTEGLVDVIEEIRLRTWARQNYTEPKNRVASWPNIVHDEMERRDRELERQAV